MKIIELPIEFEFNGQKNHINPSLIISKDELTLVDTGYPNFLPLIENEIIKNGYEMKNLKNIIITHYDIDHIGSLYDFKKKYPLINIIASEIESKLKFSGLAYEWLQKMKWVKWRYIMTMMRWLEEK